MRFPKWKWLAVAVLVVAAAEYGATRFAWSSPDSTPASVGEASDTVALGRLVIVNRGTTTIRGQVLGSDDTVRPFFVLANDLHEMAMAPGVVTVTVESEPTAVRRVTLVRGETTTIAYGGT